MVRKANLLEDGLVVIPVRYDRNDRAKIVVNRPKTVADTIRA
jgi:hypothetical protein